jgi:hypothetical protein
MGVRGRQGASIGYGGADIGDQVFGGFFNWLIEHEKNLYGGKVTDKYHPDGPEYWWFLGNELENLFNQFVAECGDPGYTFKELMDWFNSEDNTEYRFPIPDGVGVLLVLSLLCVLFTFLRSRDKKILEETEKTN